MPFQFYHSSIFLSFKFNSCSFDFYFFVWNHFLNWFCFTILPFFGFFLPTIFNPHYFDCHFFLGSFLNWFVINFLIGPEFRVSWVANFKDLTSFRMFTRVCWVFYFSLSKLICFQFHHSILIQLEIEFYFFSLFSMEFFVGHENDLVISSLFLYHSLLGFFFNSLNW
jgi:hypothetical protein